MAHQEVLEGTWEEISAHAEEFKGRKFRLIVLPQEETEVTGVISDETALRKTAARLFAETDNLEREPSKPSGDPSETAFGKIITEKYRKMGLKL